MGYRVRGLLGLGLEVSPNPDPTPNPNLVAFPTESFFSRILKTYVATFSVQLMTQKVKILREGSFVGIFYSTFIILVGLFTSHFCSFRSRTCT